MRRVRSEININFEYFIKWKKLKKDLTIKDKICIFALKNKVLLNENNITGGRYDWKSNATRNRSSFVWWVGAVAMAVLGDVSQMYIMMVVVFLGWVLPGIFLNRQYRKRSTENE